MASMFTVIAVGILAGGGHVLTGPDHLAAVAPLSVDQRRNSWQIGLMWGIGHSSGVWLLAVLALVLRESLPLDSLSIWGERLVGFVLIAIGLLGLCRGLKSHMHSHSRPHNHRRSALGIGVLHGVAGSSHLVGVLPALLLPTRMSAAGFVIAFGIGSIAAMIMVAATFGTVAQRCHRGVSRGLGLLSTSTCLAAIAVGCWWIVTAFAPPH